MIVVSIVAAAPLRVECSGVVSLQAQRRGLFRHIGFDQVTFAFEEYNAVLLRRF